MTTIEMNTEATEVTTRDIQAKHSRNESADTRVRKSWVLQMTEDLKEGFDHLPAPVRKELYRKFDKVVHDTWVARLRAHNENARAQGARVLNFDGDKRFEDAFCVDTDEVLLDVAKTFIETTADDVVREFIAEYLKIQAEKLAALNSTKTEEA